MSDVHWGYAAEKLGAAVRAMMLPHRSESESIVWAGHNVELGFHDVDRLEDEDADRWLRTIRELLDTSDIDPETEEARERGTLAIRADQLSFEQKLELRRCLFELHSRAEMEFWGDD